MTDKFKTNSGHSETAADALPDLEKLLDDLYSLQDNLLTNTNQPSDSVLPDSLTEDDIHNLEIPILNDVVDVEIDDERKLLEQFNQAQQHLFEKPSAQQPATDQQINAIVNKLVTKMRPRIDQLLRDKIRSLVVERFNRQK